MSTETTVTERARGFTEEQASMRAVLRRFLADQSPEDRVRAVMGSEDFDRELWSQLADSFGAQAMFLPVDRGGAGLGPVEALVVAEELGRCLAVVPYRSTTAEALGLLSRYAPQDELVDVLAAGGSTAVVVGDLQPETVEQGLRVAGDGKIHGNITQVPDAATADILLVVVDEDGNPQVRVVESAADGVHIEALPTFDETRSRAQVVLDGARSRVAAAARPLDEVRAEASQWSQLHAAGEAVGGAGRCLEMTTEYVRVREQFGQEIGRFQAVKHACTEMLVQVEGARAVALRAAHELALGSDQAQLWVDVARVHTATAFDAVAAATLHLHGGIGFTWEHSAHLYVKRAISLADPGSLKAPKRRIADAFLGTANRTGTESAIARVAGTARTAGSTHQEGAA